MGFGDAMKNFFLGSKPQWELMPGAQQNINDLQAMQFRVGKPAKVAKRGYLALDRGEDVSGMGQFANIAQNEARDIADVDFNYMTGANALEGAAGGAQLNQINRMRDLARERVREGAGRQRVSALGDLRRDLYGQWQRGIENKQQQEMWRQNALMQARNQMYDARRQGGILPGLISGAAQMGMAAIPGLNIGARALGGV